MLRQERIQSDNQSITNINKESRQTWLQRCVKMGVDLEVKSFSFTLSLLLQLMTWLLLLHIIVMNDILKLKSQQYMNQLLDDNLIGLYCISVSFKVLIAINFKIRLSASNNQSSKKGFIRIILSHILEIIELDFCLSALILHQDFVYGIANFSIAAVFSITKSVFFSNTSTFNYISYISSPKINLQLRLLSIIGWIFISLSVFFDSKTLNTIIEFLFYSSILFLWYLVNGYTLFVNKRLRCCLLLMISICLSLSIVTLQMCFLVRPFSLNNFLMKYLCMSILIFVCLRFTLRQNKNRYEKMSLQQIHYEFYQNEQNDLNYKAWILGFINVTKRQNKQYLNLNQMKDMQGYQLSSNQIKLEKKIDDKNIDIELALKQMISERYKALLTHSQQFLRKSHSPVNADQYKNKLLLEYARFLLNQTGNLNKASLILWRIELDHLLLFERISVYQLRTLIVQKYSRIDHEKQPHIQLVFEFEKIYQQIWTIMRDITLSYSNAYAYLYNQQIDAAKFKKFMMIIDQKQYSCSKLFVGNQLFSLLNRKFYFLYLFYKRFVKNDKIEKYQVQVEKKLSPLLKAYKHLLDKDWLFNIKNIIFVCKHEQQQLLISNINRQFKDILLYEKEEVANMPVEILMLPQVASDHHKKVEIVLMKEEQIYDVHQNNHVVETFCLDKRGSQISVLKYYKIHINNDSELEFVCLMKYNQMQNNGRIPFCFQQSSQKTQNTFISRAQKHSQSLKLDSKSIFYKENDQLPQQKSPELFKIKFLIISVLILLLGLILMLQSIFVDEIKSLRNYLNNYILMMHCYRQPILLGTLYLRSITKQGNQEAIQMRINEVKQSFRLLAPNIGVRETLFNKQMNIKNMYYPLNGSTNLNSSYDQIDLFYLIQSQIVSLSSSPIDINSLEFQIFNDYIIPSYDNLINATKLQFHDLYHSSISDLKTNILLISLVQSVIIVFFIFFLLRIVFKFKSKLNLILNTVFNLQHDQLDLILQFWSVKKTQLSNFRKGQAQSALSAFSQPVNLKKQHQNNLNRTRKNILPQKIDVNIIIVIFTVIFMVIFILMFYSNITYISRLNQIADFQIQGFTFLQYFPCAPIVNYGIFQKYTHSLFPNNISFKNDIYFERIEACRMMGSNKYLSDNEDPNSLFLQIKRNYFYGTPCLYNPTILKNVNISIATCEKVSQGSFKNGLASAFRSSASIATNYFNNVTNISAAELSQFNIASSIIAAYILDAIIVFGNEFQERLQMLRDGFFQSIIIDFCLVATFSTIFFVYLLTKLNNEHKYYNKIFKNMIPSEYIMKEKVVRQQFVNNQIL